MQGNETFYDENRELITFKTEIEAIKWIDQYKLNPLPFREGKGIGK
jgi:hypothetical protein